MENVVDTPVAAVQMGSNNNDILTVLSVLERKVVNDDDFHPAQKNFCRVCDVTTVKKINKLEEDKQKRIQQQQQQQQQQHNNYNRSDKNNNYRSGAYNNTERRYPRATRAGVAAEFAYDIDADWSVVSEMSLQMLGTLQVNAKDVTISDVKWTGKLNRYVDKFDHIVPKDLCLINKPVQQAQYITPVEDPTLNELFASSEADVVASDRVLSTIMAAPLSRFGFRIICQREGGKLKLTKADDILDLVTMGENSNDDLPQRAHAATAAKLNTLTQELVTEGTLEDFGDCPALSSNKAYRYRMVTLPCGRPVPGTDSDHPRRRPLKVLTRGEVHAATPTEENGYKYAVVHALCDGLVKKGTWYNYLNQKRGQTIVNAVRVNVFCIGKWVYEAIICGATQFKLGFVGTPLSQTGNPNQAKHQLLTTQFSDIGTMVTQTGLKINNGFATLREVCDIIRTSDLGDGKYIITRDPFNPTLKISFQN